MAKDALDEWIYFLKKDEIKDEFKAKGLKEAKRQLDVMKLSETERNEYGKYIEQQRYERSLIVSNHRVGEIKGKIEGKAEGEINKAREIAKKLINSGVDIVIIIKSTGLSKVEIQKLK